MNARTGGRLSASRAGLRPLWLWLPVVLACAPTLLTIYLGLLVMGRATDAPDAVGATSPDSADTMLDAGTVFGREAPRPVHNDCSGGFVYLTFDDGPYIYTALVLDRLDALDLKATFFVVGNRVSGREDVVRRAVADGHSVQNHSFTHANLVTGVDNTGVRPESWGSPQIEAELVQTNAAVLAAGAPRPTEYRPPFGSVDSEVDAVARRLGLQLVMPWSDGSPATSKIVDSRDTEAGVTTDDVVRTVTAGLTAGSIITMHDGSSSATITSAMALQAVVDVMNAKRLCSSGDIPADPGGLGSR